MLLFVVWDKEVERPVWMSKVYHTSPTWGHGDTSAGEISTWRLFWYSDKHLTYYRFSQRNPFSLRWKTYTANCKLHIRCHYPTGSDTKLSLQPWKKVWYLTLTYVQLQIVSWYVKHLVHMLVRLFETTLKVEFICPNQGVQQLDDWIRLTIGSFCYL